MRCFWTMSCEITPHPVSSRLLPNRFLQLYTVLSTHTHQSTQFFLPTHPAVQTITASQTNTRCCCYYVVSALACPFTGPPYRSPKGPPRLLQGNASSVPIHRAPIGHHRAPIGHYRVPLLLRLGLCGWQWHVVDVREVWVAGGAPIAAEFFVKGISWVAFACTSIFLWQGGPVDVRGGGW